VKPFIKAHDFYPVFKLEEECFSRAVIKDVDQKITNKTKDQEPLLYPRQKTTDQIAYETFLEEVINPKTGEFYPEKDSDNRAIKNTGATYVINSIYRLRRADGSEFLYTKGRVYAYNSLGDPVNHSISIPEVWTRTKFDFKTQFDSRTNQLEKVFQGVSGNEPVYTMPFNSENLKKLYDIRQNDLVTLAVKDEATGKAVQVRDVTTNPNKSYELFRDQAFDYLFAGNYIPTENKAEARMEAVSQGLIGGNIADYNQPSSSSKSSATTARNTYQ